MDEPRIYVFAARPQLAAGRAVTADVVSPVRIERLTVYQESEHDAATRMKHETR